MTTGRSASAYVPVESIRSDRLALTARMADYLELAKPRIAAMALLTVTVGFTLGSGGVWTLTGLVSALAGIGLVAAASGAFNQLIERRTDALMARTANRPLPTGRLQPIEVAGFGLACGIGGLSLLVLEVNRTTALLAFLTLALYVAAYTPLKRYTALSTAIGAIPGALPPVLGWTASGAALGWEAFSLFAVLFLWQFPHFLAIAWLYRDDYAAAGLRMLPGGTPRRGLTGLSASVYAAVLIPVSLMPGQVALAGGSYRMAALLLGLGYLAAALRFFANESRETARGLLYCSLIYLPVLLSVLTWDHVRLLS
ncbi:MAG TPA: heme o synthase [Planctomycetaceae bacterium]|jgi:protoheme IX farnesyltransferase|nr:heme o synthase [Planctomycetaceae bacterium]